MKKFLIAFLMLAMMTTSFAGCEETSGNTSDLNHYSEASYDNESHFIPEQSSPSPENSGNESQSDSPAGSFVVKDKKYDFRGNNLVLLNVDNQTNKDYRVTVTGSYLDAEGKVIKTETRSSDQFSAGYSGYFLFEPNIAFDSFSYTFDTEETEGPFYAKDLGFRYNGLDLTPVDIESLGMQGDYTRYPCVSASFSFENKGNAEVRVWVRYLIFDENGQILCATNKVVNFPAGDTFDSGVKQFPMYQTTDKNWKYPEEWERLQIVPIIMDLTTDLKYIYTCDGYLDCKIEGSM